MKFSTVLACSAAIALAFASSAFGEDAYIESDGSDGAGINTGFFVGPQTKIEIDFQLTTNSQNQVRFFGAKGTEKSDTDPECECYIGKPSNVLPICESAIIATRNFCCPSAFSVLKV